MLRLIGGLSSCESGHVEVVRQPSKLCSLPALPCSASATRTAALQQRPAPSHVRSTLLQDGPCAFVFQNPDNQVVMPTAAAEVALGTGAQRLTNAEAIAVVRGALESVGMWEFAEVSTATLSGGQKQRLAIASALAQGPPKPKVRPPARQGPCHPTAAGRRKPAT